MDLIIEPETIGIKKPEPPPAIAPFLSRKGIAAVRRILTMHQVDTKNANFAGLPLDELRYYFTLTARAEAPQAITFGTSLVFSEPQMIKIPTGKFRMGSTKEQVDQVIIDGFDRDWMQREQPQHTVELSEYLIGKYPITNREYQDFVRGAKYKPPQGWDGEQFPNVKGSHPVVNVSWDDATAYCKWLSEKSEKKYRLPTEAEWEKAARGEDGRMYPWGDIFDLKIANTNESKISDTSDVGRFSPQGDSPYGCVDMAGNVWEWCNDWLDEKEYQNRNNDVKNPQGPKLGTVRILRGGSFRYDLGNARCTHRYGSHPYTLRDNVSFRVAVSLVPSL